MERDQVLSILAEHQGRLKQLGVKSLSLFGSVARNEASLDSDVDLLAKFEPTIGLFEFIEIRLYLEDILGCAVDLGTENALKENLREPVLRDIIHAF